MDCRSLGGKPVTYTFSTHGLPLNNDPQVLLFSDVDDTYIPWKVYNREAETDKLERTRGTLEEFRGDTINAFCSARSLSSLQQLLPYFSGIPMQILGTNGGQQVFVNYHNLPAEQWLPSLSMHDRDPLWDQRVQSLSGGFEATRALEELRDVLEEARFEKTSNQWPPPLDTRECWKVELEDRPGQFAVVALTPDQTSFMVRADARDPGAPMSEEHKALARRLADRFETKMAFAGVDAEAKLFIDKSDHVIYLLQPERVCKETLLEHLVERYPSVHAIITAGDNSNDSQLSQPAYSDVPNYRIVSGDRAEIIHNLVGQENVVIVDKGDLSPGLKSHLGNLLEPDSPG